MTEGRKADAWNWGGTDMTPPHVTPADDFIDHLEAIDDCPCGPTLQLVRQDDGRVSWAIVHHSLDGRERNT